jgi:hypothetical protein
MLIPTFTAAALLWFYFDRKDEQKSQEIIKREKQDNIRDYCLTVINSCETRAQLHTANQLVKNCTNKGYIDLNDYHVLIKRIWSMTNAIH